MRATKPGVLSATRHCNFPSCRAPRTSPFSSSSFRFSKTLEQLGVQYFGETTHWTRLRHLSLPLPFQISWLIKPEASYDSALVTRDETINGRLPCWQRTCNLERREPSFEGGVNWAVPKLRWCSKDRQRRPILGAAHNPTGYWHKPHGALLSPK